MKIALDFMGTAAVSMRSALKYRRNWNKEGPTVKLLRTLMPKGSKGFRVYFPIGAGAHINHNVARVPVAVRLAVQRAGFRITDYLAKKCVKRSDKEQKNVYNIGKVISKDPVAKAAFDNDPQLQNSSTSEFTLVVSCHPYDIIGMSTGRDWDNTSCMRLKDDRKGYNDGFNSHYLDHDISEGTLVAYAIRSNDQNITAPLGRCLLKPFLRTDDDGKKLIMYRRETKIYGNPVPGMAEALNVFLRRLNAGVPTGTYYMNSLLYNDGVADVHEHDEEESSNKIDWMHANEAEIFRDRPQMFPSYVEWMVNNVKAGEAPATSAETMIVAFAENVPARYVKQAARMIDDRDLLIAFADHMVLSSSVSDSKTYSKFCASKTFRKRMAAVADEAYMPESYAAMSHLSAKYAHKLFEEQKSRGALDDHRDLVNLAMNTIYGYNSLTKADIESLPMLHSSVYHFANYVRAASVYGMGEYQENAHKYLSILAEPEPLPIAAYVTLLDYLRDDKANAPILFAMLMEAIKNGKSNEVDLCLTSGFDTKLMATCLYERRMRRAVLGQRNNLSAKGAEMLADAIAQVYTDSDEDENHNATSAARELTAYIQKNMFDAVTAENTRTLQYSAPELIPYLFASGVQIDRDNVLTVMGNQMFAKAVRNMPRNESNKNIQKIADTFVGLISPNTDFKLMAKLRNPEPADEYPAVVDPEVLELVRKSLNDLPAYTYDLDKYPQLYSTQFYKEERPNLYAMYESGKLQSVLKHMESEESVTMMRAIAKDLSGLSPVLALVRNDDRMLADSYAMTQLMGLMRSASKNEDISESAKTVQAVVAAVHKLEAMVHDVFPPVGAHVDEWRKVIPALSDSEYPFADIAVKDMQDNVQMLKKQTRIFELLDPELAQYYPDDWPKVTA